ncbi:hypothetical protein P3X46_014503 [Hevea brasiliensis]|uniref:DUF7804 domain-containing protein n=1 Tax=Hevea brasiliensis TaxID=3981 RepID=A0ABQ9M6X5_HEVBR|nr:uncharacterized protein LOC110668056 [Hevea brasiliensis]KAJ9176009.1 hypothetical protein P3X46_014503 [Hevea brasiliensis]
MASAAIRCHGNRHFINSRWPGDTSPINQNARVGMCSVSKNACSRRKRWRICSMSMGKRTGIAVANYKNKINGGDEVAVVYEKLDEWMKNSVVEIVKNLREAPLLVQIYDKGETTTLKTEKAVEEQTWPLVMRKWEKREAPLPEGVIFVEQLEKDEKEEVEGEGEGEGEGMTRAWGIVVQGKGVDCGPVCYLLKTSRAGSSGLGVCCTHFCLMRVKNFRESARSQLKNCWLLQGQ